MSAAPDQKLRYTARETMSAHFLRHRNMGATRASGSEEFYGFRPQDVAEIFIHKHGFVRGVWFPLKDDRAWYVSTAH